MKNKEESLHQCYKDSLYVTELKKISFKGNDKPPTSIVFILKPINVVNFDTCRAILIIDIAITGNIVILLNEREISYYMW